MNVIITAPSIKDRRLATIEYHIALVIGARIFSFDFLNAIEYKIASSIITPSSSGT